MSGGYGDDLGAKMAAGVRGGGGFTGQVGGALGMAGQVPEERDVRPYTLAQKELAEVLEHLGRSIIHLREGLSCVLQPEVPENVAKHQISTGEAYSAHTAFLRQQTEEAQAMRALVQDIVDRLDF